MGKGWWVIALGMGLGALGCIDGDDDDSAATPSAALVLDGDTDGCLAISAGDTWTVDVQTIEVQVDATLNGAPVDGANSSNLDRGGLAMLSTDATLGNARIGLAPLWDDLGGYLGPLSAPVVPGTEFTLGYGCARFEADCSSWPQNVAARLDGVHAPTADTSLTVDVPAAAVTVDFTVGGGPVTAQNTQDDRPTFYLLRAGEGARVPALEPVEIWDRQGARPTGPVALTLLHGTYAVVVESAGEVAWPRAGVVDTLQVSGPGAFVVDVDPVLVEPDVRVDGAPIPPSQFGAVRLRTGPEDPAPVPLFDDSPVRVVPGTYQAVSHGGPALSPANVRPNVVAEGLSLTASGPVTIELSTVEVVLDVTLNGAAAFATADQAGTIELRHADAEVGISSSSLDVGFDLYEDGVGYAGPFTRRVLPGDYDVFWRPADDATGVAANDVALLQTVTLNADTALVVDVPTAVLEVTVLVNGAPLDPQFNGQGVGRGVVRFVREGGGGASLLTADLGTGAMIGPGEPLSVVRGTYSVEAAGSGLRNAGWPHAVASVQEGLVVDADAPVTVDVPLVMTTVDVLLDGAVPPAQDQRGALFVDTAGSLDPWTVLSSDTFHPPYPAGFAPGTYDIYVGGGDTSFGVWPSPIAYYGCVEVSP